MSNKEQKLADLISGRTISDREAHILVEAMYWKVQFDESNPEVGMGPTTEMQLEDILSYLHISVNKKDLERIHEIYKERELPF